MAIRGIRLVFDWPSSSGTEGITAAGNFVVDCTRPEGDRDGEGQPRWVHSFSYDDSGGAAASEDSLGAAASFRASCLEDAGCRGHSVYLGRRSRSRSNRREEPPINDAHTSTDAVQIDTTPLVRCLSSSGSENAC